MKKQSSLITIQLQAPGWKTLLKPYGKTVCATCEAVLGKARLRKAEVSVVLADDALVRELNRDFRGKDKPTNVLSFPGEGDHLGDIVLALETVKREAAAQGKTGRDHAVHLLVHGMLHLLGHDHEDDSEALKMEKSEIKILKKLGVNNPYL